MNTYEYFFVDSYTETNVSTKKSNDNFKNNYTFNFLYFRTYEKKKAYHQ